MAPFVVVEESGLRALEAWSRVTDWPRHGDHVPLTTVRVTTASPPGVGTVFVARTAVGPLGFDDVMEVVAWTPPVGDSPGHCRVEKRGRVMLGWQELTVQPTAQGSRVTWHEEAEPVHLPRFAAPLNDAAGRLLFGHVIRKLLA